MLNGQFPSVMAPPSLGYCYMTPNQFQSCPDQSIVENPNSLAFQCSINCIIKKDKKKSDASHNFMAYSTFITLLATSLALVF
jgi:hypothetical protein